MRRLSIVTLFAMTACATTTFLTDEVESPLLQTSTSYELAGQVDLEATAPQPALGLHNLFHLSENIVSGSEPEDVAALEELAAMGIKTILSVDGSAPDHENANRLGMRYVHVPIRYDGITAEETMAIVKSFRELPGPFYVHCFHGKHRGPAAAALGRIVVDGAPRAQAIAEMRQWCGAAGKYSGLYDDIAFDAIPSVASSLVSEFSFPQEHRIEGYRLAMIEMARHFDVLKAMAKNDWQQIADHPDWDATNSADKLDQLIGQTFAMEELEGEDEEYLGWLKECQEDSKRIAKLVPEYRAGNAAAGVEARTLVKSLKGTCNSCHSSYRN